MVFWSAQEQLALNGPFFVEKGEQDGLNVPACDQLVLNGPVLSTNFLKKGSWSVQFARNGPFGQSCSEAVVHSERVVRQRTKRATEQRNTAPKQRKPATE